jgi:hypothetical protein
MMRRLYARVICVFFLCILTACQTGDNGPKSLTGGFDWNRPLSVAILPFVVKDSADISEPDELAANLANLRIEFYRAFAGLPFEDVELDTIDRFLERKSLTTADIVSGSVDLAELGRQLNVDLFIIPSLDEYSYTMALIYERWIIGFSVSMLDVTTGTIVWKDFIEESKNKHHVTTSVEGVAMEVLTIATRDKVEDEVIQKACTRLVSKMPSIIPDVHLEVQSIGVEPTGRVFRNNDRITVALKGTPRLLAECRVGSNEDEPIQMVERSRGIYEAIIRLNNTDNGPLNVSGRLMNRIGDTTEWFSAEAALTMDNRPPQTPVMKKPVPLNGVVGKGIRIGWTHSDPKDVTTYRLLRSDYRHPKYVEIAKLSQLQEYIDSDVEEHIRYAYVVYALDASGNESRVSDSVTAYIVDRGPHVIEKNSDPIPHDFFSAASPYVIRCNVVIPRGEELIVEPGTEIILDGGAFWIEGKLVSRGTAEAPIVFKSSKPSGNQALFVSIDGIAQIEHSRFEGFFHAINVSAKELEIRDCRFQSNEMAISIGRGCRVDVIQSEFESNELAVHVGNGAIVDMQRNGFIQNRRNLLIEEGGFGKLEDNWWGGLVEFKNPSSLGVEGKVTINRCLDNPYPKGCSIAMDVLALGIRFHDAPSDFIRADLARQIIGKDPNYKMAYLWLIDYLVASYRFDEALEVYEKVAIIYPNDSLILSYRERIQVPSL